MNSVNQKKFYSIKTGGKTHLFAMHIRQAQLLGAGKTPRTPIVIEYLQNPSSVKSSNNGLRAVPE